MSRLLPCNEPGCPRFSLTRGAGWCREHHPRRCTAPIKVANDGSFGDGRCANVVCRPLREDLRCYLHAMPTGETP